MMEHSAENSKNEDTTSPDNETTRTPQRSSKSDDSGKRMEKTMSEELKKDVWDSLLHLQEQGSHPLKTIHISQNIGFYTTDEVASVFSILKQLKSEGLVQNYLDIDDVWEIPKGVCYPKNNIRSAK